MNAVWFTPSRWSPRWRVFLQSAVIVLAAVFVFAPVFRGDWLWDDNTEITENYDLRTLRGLGLAWTSPSGLDYLPLKENIQWIEWHLWGDQALGYHLATLFFHLCGAFCLWLFLRRLGLRFAWLGGLLFAIHPLVVESVAWIAEQKNTTSLPFLLLSAVAFLKFDETRRGRLYSLSLLLFLASMLCKPSGAAFPAILLLYVWWKRGRIRFEDVKVTSAFFLVSFVIGLVTIWFQQERAVGGWVLPLGGPISRAVGAGLAFLFYLGKTLWPFDLLPLYPQWHFNPPTLLQCLPWLFISISAVVFWTKRGTWGRHAIFALGSFALGLLPVLGFVPMSFMRYSWVADHFVYFPLVSVIALFTAIFGAIYVSSSGALRNVLAVGLSLVIGSMMYSSHEYAKRFLDSEALWSYAIQRNPTAWLPHNNLGHAQSKKNELGLAQANFEEAIRLKPDYPSAYGNLGAVFLRQGRVEEAVANLRRSLEIDPHVAQVQDNLGTALRRQNKLDEAIEHFERAAQEEPEDADIQLNLGLALSAQGRVSSAIDHLQTAVRLSPSDAEARSHLADALAKAGRNAEANVSYREALQIRPDFPEALVGFANLLVSSGKPQDALPLYERAIRLRPQFFDAHFNLGHALAGLDRASEALVQFQEAVHLKPASAEAHFAIGSTLAQLNQIGSAIAPFQEAVRLKPDYGEAHTNLANALLISGRATEAISEYREALRINPNDTLARDYLSQAETMIRQRSGR